MPTFLTYRDARPSDGKAAWRFLSCYAHLYLQTGETLTREWVNRLIAEEPVWVVEQGDMSLVGLLWWADLHVGQTVTVHFLIEPRCIRLFLRSGLGEQLLHAAQARWQLRSIQAVFEANRQRPIHWLTRFGFKEDPQLWEETPAPGETPVLYRRRYRLF